MSAFNVEKDLFSSKQMFWEKYSSIRSKERYQLSDVNIGEYYFPISRQQICNNEFIQSLGEEKKTFILTQSLYKNLHDIIEIEPTLIYNQAIAVAKNYTFSSKIRIDAFTVAIDEAYHGYQAADIMEQVKEKTKIEPLKFPDFTQLGFAIQKTKEQLPSELYDDFELIAISIAENTASREAGSLLSEKDLQKTLKQYTYDHMIDEARHSRIFLAILYEHWRRMPIERRTVICKVLAVFVNYLLRQDSQKFFDEIILNALDISQNKAKKILSNIYLQENESAYKAKNRSAFNNITKFLEEAGLFSDTRVKSDFENFRFGAYLKS